MNLGASEREREAGGDASARGENEDNDGLDCRRTGGCARALGLGCLSMRAR